MELLTLSKYLTLDFVRKNTVKFSKEINYNLEASRRILDNEGKLVFFSKIRDSNIPLVANTLFSRHVLHSILNVRSDEELYVKFLNALSSPKKLKESKINEYYVKLKDFNIGKLPVLKFYPRDAGRYVTSSVILASDGKGNYNASIHRLLLLNKNTLVIRIVQRHLYKMYMEFKKRGENIPVIILVGLHPLMLLLSSFSPPYGVYEMEVANSLLNGAIRADYLTKYEIPVPLIAEMVWIGEINVKEEHDEGPFVDILGVYDVVRKQPLLHVKEVWIRENPIFQEILPGGLEHRLLMGFPKEVTIWDAVRKVIPKVKAVRLTPGGAGWLHAVISIDKQSEGDGKNAILAAFSAHPSLKHVIIVDNDINVDNISEIEWAIATRFRADKDLVIISNVRGSSLDPMADDSITAKMGLDATRPLDKPKELFEKARMN